NANWSQGAAKAAVDWETNRIMIAYQGVHPNSPPTPEVLGLWAKIVDGSNGALLTGLLTVQNGFTIEAVPVFLPERDGFLVAWTGFTPGRDVQGRFVSSATGAVGTMPAGVYTISGSSRSEGAAMGMYEAASRRVLMAVQSSGGCPNDTCPYLDGAILDGQGTPLSVFTGLSTATPSSTGGTFYPDVAVGENGQFGISYTLDYIADYVERVSLPLASTPGPVFNAGTSAALSIGSLSFATTKIGAVIGGAAPQTVGVSFTADPVAWSAASSVPWLQVTNGSGLGSGAFTVTVINPGDVIGSQTSLSGSVVLTATGALNSPLTLAITLTVVPMKQTYLNGDGLADAFAYNAGNGNWASLLSQSGGGFAQNLGSWSPNWTVASARFNADALTDFFLFNATTGQWSKMINTGSGFTIQSSGAWWPGWQRLVMDADGDGISDVFVYDFATGAWFKCISTPTGFTYLEGTWNPGWEIYPMALNGDAIGDMFLFNRTTGRWFWAIGQAGHLFTYPASQTWFPSWMIYPGDYNGDGLSDLLLHDPPSGQYFVAMNNGSGFSYTQGVWPQGSTPYPADIDADGADDLLLHNSSTGQWVEMISNGQGGFTNAGGQTWVLGWTIHPTDLNGDRRSDFLLYNPSTGAWFQAMNLVTGSFSYTGGYWAPGLTIIARAPIR
ncbi:MAG: hypothetical protein ABIP90_06705, partial [Vicinamibacterales bacterium]